MMPSPHSRAMTAAMVVALCLSSTLRAQDAATFHGVTTGMRRQAAFEILCRSGARLLASELLLANGRESFMARPLACADWPVFEKADFWTLQDMDLPCADKSLRTAAISLVGDGVDRLQLRCARAASLGPTDPDPP